MILIALCTTLATGMMYDVISPLLVSQCDKGCEVWSKVSPNYTAWWSSGVPPSNAANHCAQLANAPGLNTSKPRLDPQGVGGQGAWCVCAEGSSQEWTYCKRSGPPPLCEVLTAVFSCRSPLGVPEQINLQAASPDTVVVSFVTFEASTPSGLPSAVLSREGAASSQHLQGVTHTYHTPAHDRTYYMHFVKFPKLQPRARYTYKVPLPFPEPKPTCRIARSRAAGPTLPGVASFHSGALTVRQMGRTPRWPSSVTWVCTAGTTWRTWPPTSPQRRSTWWFTWEITATTSVAATTAVAMATCRTQTLTLTPPLTLTMLEAYQKVIASVPWLPVVGNHEFYDGDKLARYLNQTEVPLLNRCCTADLSP